MHQQLARTLFVRRGEDAFLCELEREDVVHDGGGQDDDSLVGAIDSEEALQDVQGTGQDRVPPKTRIQTILAVHEQKHEEQNEPTRNSNNEAQQHTSANNRMCIMHTS